MTDTAPASEGWRPDPFGRYEARFYDGSKWTPYVKDGEEHALDEPVESIDRSASQGPKILDATVMIVEQHVDENNRMSPYAVVDKDGETLATVRRNDGDDKRLDIVDDTGAPCLSLQIVSSGRKRIVSVRNPGGAELGRLVQQHLPGIDWFAMESAAGQTIGYIRARTWVGWDVRVEDDQSRTVATVTKLWDDLDRSVVGSPDNYIVRINRERPDPFRTLMVAAAIGLDTALKQDARGFN